MYRHRPLSGYKSSTHDVLRSYGELPNIHSSNQDTQCHAFQNEGHIFHTNNQLWEIHFTYTLIRCTQKLFALVVESTRATG